MPRSQRVSSRPSVTVRRDWLAATAHVCHTLVALAHDIAALDLLHGASALLDDLPPSHGGPEETVQRGLLLQTAVQFGHDAHVTFHRRYPRQDHSLRSCWFVASRRSTIGLSPPPVLQRHFVTG